MSATRHRTCIDDVRCQFKVSELWACRVLEQHHSTRRHVPRGRADEDRLVADMIELARQSGRYGYCSLAERRRLVRQRWSY